ncbi:MAG: hypothetical protein IKR93_03070 [Firmicutes bacterium]|nr:hypothetical protein [Bacillota bacterium]
MISAKIELEAIMSKIKIQEDIVNRKLSTIHDGKLMIAVNNGLPTNFIVTEGADGKRNRKVCRDERLVRELLMKELYSEESKRLRINRDIIGSSLNRLLDTDFDSISDHICQKHSLVTPDMINTAAFLSNEYLHEWARAPFEQLQFRPEMKTKRTSSGILVRTKGEALWAEKLHEYDLPFRYEQVVHCGESVYAPDFTVLRKDGKLFYIEHMGFIGNDRYYAHQEIKLRAYRSIGIRPEDNLIITFESSDGSIDIEEIDWIIRHKLLL